VVEGEGVVGQQPRLAPGESFRYGSYCPLTTEWGTMEGTFTMLREDGSRFEAQVRRFYLVGAPE
jgi:ApaG protein